MTSDSRRERSFIMADKLRVPLEVVIGDAADNRC
jgi:hypothetical protein